LEACSYLDSTFLGILLGLGLKLKDAGNGLLHILNASPRNMELLKNLGLDRLIDIEGGEAPSGLGPLGGSEGPSDPVRPVAGNGGGNGGLGAGRIDLNGVAKEDLREMPCPVPTRTEAAPTILEAHETLMNFDPRNVPKFKDVVEFLREDLGQPAAKN
jgi:hypothetical protein